MVHGQHIATARQMLRRVAHRWSRRYGVSAVYLVFEHEMDGTSMPFCEVENGLSIILTIYSKEV